MDNDDGEKIFTPLGAEHFLRREFGQFLLHGTSLTVFLLGESENDLSSLQKQWCHAGDCSDGNLKETLHSFHSRLFYELFFRLLWISTGVLLQFSDPVSREDSGSSQIYKLHLPTSIVHSDGVAYWIVSILLYAPIRFSELVAASDMRAALSNATYW